MNFLHLLNLLLKHDGLTSTERELLAKQIVRLGIYIESGTRTWARALRPTKDDIDELRQEAMTRLIEFREANPGADLGTGLLARIVKNLRLDFLDRKLVRRVEQLSPLDEVTELTSDGGALPNASLQSSVAENERMQSEIRLDATIALRQLDAQLDLNDPKDAEERDYHLTVLACAIADLQGDRKDCEQAASAVLNSDRGWTPGKVKAVRRRAKRLVMSEFFKTKLSVLGAHQLVPESLLWGRSPMRRASAPNALEGNPNAEPSDGDGSNSDASALRGLSSDEDGSVL